MAKLYFKYGTMNSGKTLDIIRTAYNYEEVNCRAYVLKPKLDTKGEHKIVARVGAERAVDYLFTLEDNMFDLIQQADLETKINVVLIDEGQFLTREQVDQLMDVVTDLDISIICFGIRSDFRGELFEGSQRLLTIAHELEEIKTMCFEGCGHKAIYNDRYVDGKLVTDGDQLCIDDQENIEYKAVCPKCRKRNWMAT